MTVELVRALEAELRIAMLAGDVAMLDRLLADDVLYTGPRGDQLDKAADLAAHSSRRLRLDRLDVLDEAIRVTGDAAVTLVRARIAGSYDGAQIAGTFAYTRVWSLVSRQVIAAACTAVAE